MSTFQFPALHSSLALFYASAATRCARLPRDLRRRRLGRVGAVPRAHAAPLSSVAPVTGRSCRARSSAAVSTRRRGRYGRVCVAKDQPFGTTFTVAVPRIVLLLESTSVRVWLPRALNV